MALESPLWNGLCNEQETQGNVRYHEIVQKLSVRGIGGRRFRTGDAGFDIHGVGPLSRRDFLLNHGFSIILVLCW